MAPFRRSRFIKRAWKQSGRKLSLRAFVRSVVAGGFAGTFFSEWLEAKGTSAEVPS